MVKRAKSEKPAKSIKGTAPDPKPELTDEQTELLFVQHRQAYEKALAAKKKADADLKNVCKKAKSELGDQIVRQIKTALDLDTEEGEERLRRRLAADIQVAKWMGVEIGTQFDMFGDGAGSETAVDRARREGARDAAEHKPLKTDYAPETPEYSAYADAYHDVQGDIVRKGIKAPATDDEDEAPSGERLSRSEWAKRMQSENGEVDASIKDQAGKLGSKKASYALS